MICQRRVQLRRNILVFTCVTGAQRSYDFCWTRLCSPGTCSRTTCAISDCHWPQSADRLTICDVRLFVAHLTCQVRRVLKCCSDQPVSVETREFLNYLASFLPLRMKMIVCGRLSENRAELQFFGEGVYVLDKLAGSGWLLHLCYHDEHSYSNQSVLRFHPESTVTALPFAIGMHSVRGVSLQDGHDGEKQPKFWYTVFLYCIFKHFPCGRSGHWCCVFLWLYR